MLLVPPTAGLDEYGAWPPLTVTLWFIVMPASETMLSSTPATPSQLVSMILNPPKEAPREVGTGTAGVREGVGRTGDGLRMRGSEGVEDAESGPVWPGGGAEAEEEGRPRFMRFVLAIETSCGRCEESRCSMLLSKRQQLVLLVGNPFIFLSFAVLGDRLLSA
jgi:hypothetical protein